MARTAGKEHDRPEMTTLTVEQKHRVLTQLHRHDTGCSGCGGRDVSIGDALYLGFLFQSESDGIYLVALRCQDPDCSTPRTGVRVHESQFLEDHSSTA